VVRNRFSLCPALIVVAVALVPASAPAAPGEQGCDPLDPAVCLQPWPNDHFTVADPSTDTGRRLNLNPLAMPRNIGGNPIRPEEWNRSDGFSPGSMIITVAPGVNPEMSGAPLITDMERSLNPDSATVIVDTVTGELHRHWAELDADATSDATRALILRPGINLREGRRYVVGLQHLVDGGGRPLQPNAVFTAYRDGIPTSIPAIENRRPRMESIFATLDSAGVDRADLYLAWDFTVASQRGLSERLLFMRDNAFATLGGAAPTFTVSGITNNVDSEIYRQVTGTFNVPRYVNSPATNARMTYLNLQGQGAGLPDRYLPDQSAPFTCRIPRSATTNGLDPVTPARPSLYGHGLLGTGSGEVGAGNVDAMALDHRFMFCATDWIGMSTLDVPTVALVLADMSNFPAIPDRLQQAVLNFLFLARLMIHPNGFVSNPAFQAGLPLKPLIDTSEAYYDGNSQGGIMGGITVAVSQDITKGVLGVPAMNYSTLLRRSVDYDMYKIALNAAYLGELDRNFIYSLIQILWDRGETNGYAHHLTGDPYPNTPPHRVLLHEAFGDHQVANVATEVETRTIGAQINQPALASGRHSDLYPFDGIDPIPSFPHPGSALIVWDSGTPTPPTADVPPTAGSDPHSRPRSQPSARVQKSQFLSPTGGVIDVCGGAPCLAP
jgi:hypothetical protein